MTPRTLADLLDFGSDDEPHPTTPAQGFTPGVLVPGDQIYFLSTTTILISDSAAAGGVLVGRGSVVTITDEILRLNVDRYGWSWLSLVDDIPVQIEKWGQQLFGRGPFPADQPRYVPGSPEETDERNRRREAAKFLPEAEATAERARIREELGTGGGTTTLGTFGAADERGPLQQRGGVA